jgi:transposase
MLAALRLRRPRRFACATCQRTFTERVAWREPGFAYTLRYAQHVYARTQQADMAQVALNEGLSQDTVRSIFERWAKKRSTNAATRL